MALKKLIITSCDQCTNCNYVNKKCTANNQKIDDFYSIPEHCPLESGVRRYDLKQGFPKVHEESIRDLFGYNFKRLMQEQDLIQSDLIKALDVKKDTILGWARGSIPRDEHFHYLRVYLNAEYADFFKGKM